MFIAGTSQSKIIGITGTFSMLVILGVVVIMTANKFFSMINHLPEHVTNWIGQQLHSLGEQSDQAGVKNVFVGSTNAISSGAQGVKELRSQTGGNSRSVTTGNAAAPSTAMETTPSGGRISEGNFRS